MADTTRGVRLLRLAVVLSLLAAVVVASGAPGTEAVAGQAGAGDLDATFDDDGIATTEFDSSVSLEDAAVVHDGPAAGTTLALVNGQVWRFLPDGSLDPSFDDEGVLDLEDSPDALAVRPGGGFVVLVERYVPDGHCSGNDDLFFEDRVVAFAPDGSVDRDFGDDGEACLDSPEDVADNWDEFTPNDLVVQDDGRLVATGYIPRAVDQVQPAWSIAVARLMADGTAFDDRLVLDSTDLGVPDRLETRQEGEELVKQSDGKIVLAASATHRQGDGQYGVTVARFLPDGPDLQLDPDFGGDGVVHAETEGFDPGDGLGLAITPQPAPGGAPVGEIGVLVRTSVGADTHAVRLIRWPADPPPEVTPQVTPEVVPAAAPAAVQASQVDGSPHDITFPQDVEDIELTDLSASPSGFLGAVDVTFADERPHAIGVVAYDTTVEQPAPRVTLVSHPDGELVSAPVISSSTRLLPRPGGGVDLLGELDVNPDSMMFFRSVLARTRLVETTDDGELVAAVDEGFGDDGFVLTQGDGADGGLAVDVEPDGRVLAAGNGEFALRHAENGSLDTTFGADTDPAGVAFADFEVYGMARDTATSAGRVVLVGGLPEDGFTIPGVQRFLSDGTPDPFFNDGSPVFVDALLGEGSFYGQQEGALLDAAVQPDGSIVVVGTVTIIDSETQNGPQQSVLVARLQPDGALDPAFGQDLNGDGTQDGIRLVGQVPMPWGESSSGFAHVAAAKSVALTTDGDIVVAGTLPEGAPSGFPTQPTPSDARLMTARFTPDGAPDPTYAVTHSSFPYGDGVQLDDVAATDAFGLGVMGSHGDAVAVRPDGQVVVAGSLDVCHVVVDGPCRTSSRLVVVQHEPDGAADLGFGDAGAVVWSPGEDTSVFGTGVALDAMGDVVVGGHLAEAPEDDADGDDDVDDDVLVARLLPGGQFDPVFGDDGVVVTDVGADDASHDLAIGPDGRILVSGRTADDRSSRVLVNRYLPGSPSLDCVPDPMDARTVALGGSTIVDVTCTAVDGLVAITGLAIDPTSTDPDDFAVHLDNCTGVTLGDGDSCDLSVWFAPSAPGDHAATLTVDLRTVEGSSTSTVGLRGRGALNDLPGILVAPDPVEFAERLVATSSPSRTVTATNAGNVTLSVTTVALTGPDAADFTVATNGCTAGSLAPGGTCDVEVTFRPRPGGALQRSAVLRLEDSATGSPSLVRLRGSVLAASVVIVPGEGPVETEVEVSGSGFASGVAITLRIDGTVVGRVPAGEVVDGGFTTTVVVAVGTAGGDQPVVACQECGGDRAWQARTSFTVTPRLFVEPALGPPGFVAAVRGDGFEAGTQVVLTWDRGIGAGRVVPDADGEFTTSMLVFQRDHIGERLLGATPAGTDGVVADAPFLVVPGTVQPGDFAIRS